MAENTVSDIIDYSIDGDVTKIQASVDSYMKEKVAEVLAARKIEVSKNLFNSDSEE